MVRISDLPPPHLWRYLVQRYFQRTYPDTPVVVANASVLLNAWLKPTDRAFEWGSGRSTTFFARRVGSLTSIEHDPAWYEQVKGRLAEEGLAGKVDYRLVPAPAGQMEEPEDSPYARAIDAVPDGSLDLVIVDGQMRLRCAERSLGKLKPMGLLVIDGANRYLPNDFEGGHTTLRVWRDEPLDEGWRALSARLADWRAIHTTDFLWDTRMWVKPAAA
jgi:hypothetical protein